VTFSGMSNPAIGSIEVDRSVTYHNNSTITVTPGQTLTLTANDLAGHTFGSWYAQGLVTFIASNQITTQATINSDATILIDIYN